MDRKTYTFDEAFKASLDYFTGDELAAKVWVNKYALKDAFGNIYEESPNDMHHRLASEIARVEKKYPNPLSEQELFDLFDHFRYIVPQGSPMTGIGNDYQIASLSNCFVIGLDGQADSYGAIIRIDEEQVQLMKRRGGVGHDLSHIRPKGSPVKNSALTSTGLVPFMERYSNSTREVAQDGRRGALMLSVSIKHPDSEAFIDAKMTEGKVTGANVSVKIDDDFMNAAVNGGTYKQQYPIDSDSPVYVKDIDASGLWKKIIHNAWKSAEPGVLFWDTILRESVPDCYADLGFRTVSKSRFDLWGRVKIRHQLRLNGVAGDVVEEAMAEIDEDEYVANLRMLLAAKSRTLTVADPYKRKASLMRYGASRGYEPSLVLKVMAGVVDGAEDFCDDGIEEAD